MKGKWRVKTLLIAAAAMVMAGSSCLKVEVNNRWKVPGGGGLSVKVERTGSGQNSFRRILSFEENYTSKNKIIMATAIGDYTRANVYKISDRIYLIKDYWNDYEINAETKTLRQLDAGSRSPGGAGEYLGAFDENESGGWRFIPAAERKEIPLGEKKLK